MHGWRGHVVTKRASEEAPKNLTPAVSGSQEFVLGVFVLGVSGESDARGNH